MNIRYKKMLLLILLSIMGVGMLSLSLGHLDSKASQDKAAPAASLDHLPKENIQEKERIYPYSIFPGTTPSVTDSPSQADPSGAKPIYIFETKTYPEIEALIQEYYLAKGSSDVDHLSSLISDPSYKFDLETITNENRFIEDFGEPICYIKKSYQEGAYIVYAYHEVKYYNITTPAPYLDKFYVVTDSEGKVKLYSSDYSGELAVYYEARNKDSDVISLIEKTNQNLEKALKKDENLKKYLEELAGYHARLKDSVVSEGDGK